jgi:hypothetical protein
MPNHNEAPNPIPSPSAPMNRFGNEVRITGTSPVRFLGLAVPAGLVGASD